MLYLYLCLGAIVFLFNRSRFPIDILAFALPILSRFDSSAPWTPQDLHSSISTHCMSISTVLVLDAAFHAYTFPERFFERSQMMRKCETMRGGYRTVTVTGGVTVTVTVTGGDVSNHRWVGVYLYFLLNLFSLVRSAPSRISSLTKTQLAPDSSLIICFNETMHKIRLGFSGGTSPSGLSARSPGLDGLWGALRFIFTIIPKLNQQKNIILIGNLPPLGTSVSGHCRPIISSLDRKSEGGCLWHFNRAGRRSSVGLVVRGVTKKSGLWKTIVVSPHGQQHFYGLYMVILAFFKWFQQYLPKEYLPTENFATFYGN